jgi:hypothetical protein
MAQAAIYMFSQIRAIVYKYMTLIPTATTIILPARYYIHKTNYSVNETNYCASTAGRCVNKISHENRLLIMLYQPASYMVWLAAWLYL